MEKLDLKDLRIGNFVKWKDNDSIFEITLELFCNKAFQNHIENGYIVGIPITSEILFNLKGFYQNITPIKDISSFEHNEFGIFIMKRFDSFNIGFGVKEIREIHFLHDIQNFYYLIFKEELEFKTELK